MGVRILYDRQESRAVLYDSVTGFAFGPAFYNEYGGVDAEVSHCINAEQFANRFLDWLGDEDARTMSDTVLENKSCAFIDHLRQETAEHKQAES